MPDITTASTTEKTALHRCMPALASRHFAKHGLLGGAMPDTHNTLTYMHWREEKIVPLKRHIRQISATTISLHRSSLSARSHTREHTTYVCSRGDHLTILINVRACGCVETQQFLYLTVRNVYTSIAIFACLCTSAPSNSAYATWHHVCCQGRLSSSRVYSL